MKWRVQWTERGHFAPRWHDTYSPEAAEAVAGGLRVVGMRHVSVSEIGQECPGMAQNGTSERREGAPEGEGTNDDERGRESA